MHDRNGKTLAVGDKVLFEGTITDLSPGEDYCNVSVESDFGRRPDGAKEKITAINTGVLTKVEAATDEAPAVCLACKGTRQKVTQHATSSVTEACPACCPAE